VQAGTSSPRSRARRPRPRTSPAAFPASRSSSRRASRRSTRSSPRSTASCRWGRISKGKRKIQVVPEVGAPGIHDPPRKHITVHDGERIRAGEALMDGSPNPHDISGSSGTRNLPGSSSTKSRRCTGSRGADQRQAHRDDRPQMLRRVKITDPGDTSFLVGQSVEKWIFPGGKRAGCEAGGGKPATAEPLLLGITKASLSTESVDLRRLLPGDDEDLNGRFGPRARGLPRGLKENVIMGRLIPGGTEPRRTRPWSSSPTRRSCRGSAHARTGPEYPKEEEEGR